MIAGRHKTHNKWSTLLALCIYKQKCFFFAAQWKTDKWCQQNLCLQIVLLLLLSVLYTVYAMNINIYIFWLAYLNGMEWKFVELLLSAHRLTQVSQIFYVNTIAVFRSFHCSISNIYGIYGLSGMSLSYWNNLEALHGSFWA